MKERNKKRLDKYLPIILMISGILLFIAGGMGIVLYIVNLRLFFWLIIFIGIILLMVGISLAVSRSLGSKTKLQKTIKKLEEQGKIKEAEYLSKNKNNIENI